MSLHSPLIRLVVAAATGALLSTAATAPAIADDGRSGHRAATPRHSTPPAHGTTPEHSTTPAHGTTPEHGTLPEHSTARQNSGAPDHPRPRFTRGVVTARGGLALRTRPDLDSRVLRLARPGRLVWIFCRTLGEPVDGTRVWYLLSDGVWAWGSARYIATIGPTPRWC
ncbi:SH3 domain-containing protein [Streptomyces sp. NPDC127105]|uniref:SH3 domain-containing protein n=1 Tax=Streptomyces sp. NPDC127105 TaxID=3345359 RepID=UPI00365C0DD8